VTNVLSSSAVQDLLALVRRQFREQCPAADLDAADQWTEALVRQLAPLLLAAVAEECDPQRGYHGRTRACGCGAQARFVNYRSRWIQGLCGEIQVKRAYYHCSTCQHGHVPWDTAQGVNRTSFTPRLQARLTELTARLTYHDARRVFAQFTGRSLGVSTLEAVTQAVGEAARQEEEAQLAAYGEHGTFPPALPGLATHRGKRLYVGIDAARAHIAGEWHDVKTAVVYAGTEKTDPQTGERREGAGPLHYLAKQEGAEGFGQRLYLWATRLGVERAAEVVVLGDGAEWIWNLAERHFSDAVQILDFYHAAEYLWRVARTVFGDGDTRGRTWATKRCQRLAHRGPRGLLRALRALQRVGERVLTRPEAAAAVAKAIQHFEMHQERMNYPQYRERGLMIGSGPVEAACKVMVGGRLKGPGMRWSAPGADAVLAVRALAVEGRHDELIRFARAA